TALIEKNDFASGTSSRSTKLIHGGLRYLKRGEVGLVREVARERAVVHRMAPHLVHPEKMLLPLVHDGSFGRFSTSLGVWLYDYLAKVAPNERRQMLNRAETLQQEPLLAPELLTGGCLYTEYRTDDARLVLSVLKTAHQLGATIVNYVKASGFVNNAVQCV